MSQSFGSRKRRSPLDELYAVTSVPTPKRHRRDLTLVVTSISAVASIFSIVLSVGSAVQQAFSIKEFQNKNTRIIKSLQQEIESYATLSSAITNDLEHLS